MSAWFAVRRGIACALAMVGALCGIAGAAEPGSGVPDADVRLAVVATLDGSPSFARTAVPAADRRVGADSHGAACGEVLARPSGRSDAVVCSAARPPAVSLSHHIAPGARVPVSPGRAADPQPTPVGLRVTVLSVLRT